MLLAKLFRELFLGLSFLWQKFRCKIFDSGTFVHTFVECLRAFRRSRAPRDDIFTRQGNFFTSHELKPIRFYHRLDPNVTTRDSLLRISRFLKVTQGRCKYLAESVEPDFFNPKDGFFFLKGKCGSKENQTRNVEDTYIYKKERKPIVNVSLDDIARSRSSRSQLYTMKT